MDLAWVSLAALLLVIVVSCTTTVNAGLLSLALAWVLGVYVAPALGTPLSLKDVVAGFPAELCLTLVGVTLLFSQAHVNGTLERLARFAVRGCRGDLGLIPVMFFVLTLLLSSIGAGNIAGAALMAPLAMVLARRAGIPALLMSIVVTHGAIAGALSPFSPTGIIANKLMRERIGLSDFEGQLYLYNLAANALVGLGGFLVLGGWRLFGRKYRADEASGLAGAQAGASAVSVDQPPEPDAEAWLPRHFATLLVIGLLIGSVILLKVHVGMGAFAGAVVLTLVRAADERKSMQTIPWSVIVMVCGVTVLTSLLERTGGLDRFAELISHVATPRTVAPVIAFLTGVLSVYSSTSGVVLPAFLPMVPKLISQLGGGDPLGVACSIVVGGHLVDSSPLSTIGALCLASAPMEEDRRKLFHQLLVWGLSMALVGAAVCFLFFGMR
jgi:Na+/H+ antiporter NhaD/arsenite permease-like protein